MAFPSKPGCVEVTSEVLVIAAGHVNDERRMRGDESVPLDTIFAGTAVRGCENDAGGKTAIGEGDSGSRGAGKCGGDSRDNFMRDTSFLQRLDLFTRTSKDGWISALEPHRGLGSGTVVHEKRIDLFLSKKLLTAALADVDDLSRGRDQFKNRRADQRIVQDYIGGLQQANGFDGEQFGITGASANQENSAHRPASFLLRARANRS